MSNALIAIDDDRMKWFNPCVLTVRTIAAAADSLEMKKWVLTILERLAEDPAHTFLKNWYTHGIAHYGAHWRYLDAMVVLAAYARLARPSSYLEIGVRNGKSLCIVAAACPDVEIVGFDLFQASYAGFPTYGRDHIRREAARLGHAHPDKITLIAGDSHQTVSQYLRERPSATFDLIYVDGDHSEHGARQDLNDVIDRLAHGGLLVFDDIANPSCPNLLGVWTDVATSHPELDTLHYVDAGTGVAFALKSRAAPGGLWCIEPRSGGIQ